MPVPESRKRRILKTNIAARLSNPENRSRLHSLLARLVGVNSITKRQAETLIYKINAGHIAVEDAHLLVSCLAPFELAGIINIMKRPAEKAERKQRFFEKELPEWISLARKRAAGATQIKQE